MSYFIAFTILNGTYLFFLRNASLTLSIRVRGFFLLKELIVFLLNGIFYPTKFNGIHKWKNLIIFFLFRYWRFSINLHCNSIRNYPFLLLYFCLWVLFDLKLIIKLMAISQPGSYFYAYFEVKTLLNGPRRRSGCGPRIEPLKYW